MLRKWCVFQCSHQKWPNKYPIVSFVLKDNLLFLLNLPFRKQKLLKAIFISLSLKAHGVGLARFWNQNLEYIFILQVFSVLISTVMLRTKDRIWNRISCIFQNQILQIVRIIECKPFSQMFFARICSLNEYKDAFPGKKALYWNFSVLVFAFSGSCFLLPSKKLCRHIVHIHQPLERWIAYQFHLNEIEAISLIWKLHVNEVRRKKTHPHWVSIDRDEKWKADYT